MFKGEFETNALEATLHGLRDAILQQSDYHTMSQCESLEDMKAYLSSTEYNVTLNELSVLTPRALFESIQEHIVRQYNDFRNECVEPLATFLDFIAWEYMIMNVVKLLVAHQRDDLSAVKSSDNMLQRCHPMGIFAGLSMLRTSHNVDEMFEAVLLESPVGRFFRKASGKDIEELSIEFVRGILYKEWLEQFYEFCQSIGGVTAEIMGELLAFEADRFTLTVAVNTMTLQGRISQEERRSLYPSIGKLAELSEALSRVDTEEELRERIKVYPEYTNMFEASRSATMAGGIGSKDHTTLESTKSIERIFREKLVEMNCNSFHQQAHLGVFYSYFKLKEMENENILWIAECISQNMKHRILDFTPIF